MAQQNQMQDMEFVLSGPRIRTFSRVLNCLARIGSELLLHAEVDELTFRTLNTAKSAFAAVTFKPPFFDVFSTHGWSAQSSVLLKSVCTVFRTPASHMETLTIIIPRDAAAKTQWRIDLANGVRKVYSISRSEDCEVVDAIVDRSTLPSHLVVKPKDLNKILSNFQSTLGELTVVATEPGSTPLATVDAAHKTVLFRSFLDPAKDLATDSAMHTALWLDPGEELQAYHHTGPPTDVTFSLRDLRAFTAFCEGAEADMEMHFFQAARPVLFAPRFPPNDYAHAHMEGTLILATIKGSQLGPNATHPINLGPAFGGAANQAQDVGGGRRDAAPDVAGLSGAQGGAAPGSNPSSRLWSDLSGGGNRGRGSGQTPTDHRVGPSGTASEEIHLPRPGGSRAGPHGAGPSSSPHARQSPPHARSFPPQGAQSSRPLPEPAWVSPGAHDPAAWQRTPRAQEPPAPPPPVQPCGNPNAWLDHHNQPFTEEDEEEEYVPSTPEDRRGQHS